MSELGYTVQVYFPRVVKYFDFHTREFALSEAKAWLNRPGVQSVKLVNNETGFKEVVDETLFHN